MAGDPIVFGVFDADGQPVAGATPAFIGSLMYRHDTLASAPAPAITERDSGYAFTPSAVEEAIGYVGLLDAGAGRYFEGGSRYMAVTIPEAAQFEAFVLVDASGAPWTGTAPTFDEYEGTAGDLTPQPTIGRPIAGSGLFTFTPTSSDIAAGVSYRIAAAANSYPSWLVGSATAPTTGPYSPPSAGTYPADAVAQMLEGTIALPDPPGGSDVVLTYAADGNLLRGPVRAREGTYPPLCVFVLQSGGSPPMPYMGTSGESWHVTRVQVTVRSDPGKFEAGEALARALHSRAHLNTPPGYTYSLATEADPVYVGTDDDNAHRFVFNLDVGHRR